MALIDTISSSTAIIRSNLNFSPTLPKPIQDHFSNLTTRNLEKLILTFPNPSLLNLLFEGSQNLRIAAPGLGKFTIVDLRIWEKDAAGAMIFLTDELAQKVSGMTEDEAQKFGMELISAGAHAGGARLPSDMTPDSFTMTRWSRDPYALGSFTSYTGPKDSYSPVPPLTVRGTDGEEESWCVFAGEHTPPLEGGEEGMEGGGMEQVGTVQGAWMSGVRAGEEIALEYLSSKL
jgi:monoamine oxidase